MEEPMSTNEDNDSLHIAVRSGKKEKMLKILGRRPTLIYHQNMRGDTALHIAAEAGHLGIVELLISFFQYLHSSQNSGNRGNIEIEAIWKTRNHDGSTALHEALRNKQEEIALHLLDVDSELVEFANAKNESPLYLAAKAGFVRVLHKILEVGTEPNTLGPNSRTPFHAAVFAKSKESIEVLYGSIAALINEKDLAGKTALYYATQENSLEIIRQLLELDASALERDNEGLSPLLVAVKKGHLASTVAILIACPTSIDSSDNSGRNALHLAMMHNTIERFKKLLSFAKINALANKGDREGNTPLHLAIIAQKYLHAQALLHLTKVESKAKNNAEQTAFDLCLSHGNLSNEQRQIRDALDKASKLCFLRRYMTTCRGPSDVKLPELKLDMNMSAATNAMSVVAAVIATITFTAAFQMPGGYDSASGYPTLINSRELKIFIITDTLAFCFSLTALYKLISASINDEVSSANVNAVRTSGGLLYYSLLFAVITFYSGIYAVMPKESRWVAALVTVMSTIIGWYFIIIYYNTKLSDLFKKNHH